MALPCILSLLLALSWSTFAFPTSENAARGSGTFKTSIFEKLNGPPAGWIKDEAANIDKDASTIRLRIHLVQRNMEKFHELAVKVLQAVSLGLKDV
jgi:tripeptidyl-peptidase-1